jgi:hypothetical protein
MVKFIKENWFVMMIGAIVSSIFTQLYLVWCKHNFPKELPVIKDLIAILVVLIIYKKLDSAINYAASKFNSRGQSHLSKIVNIIISSILLSGVFLFLFDNGNWIADMINFAVAIGTIALAIFGWFAYKDYWKQKRQDTVFNQIMDMFNLLITDSDHLYLKIFNYLNRHYSNFNKDIPRKFTLEYVDYLMNDIQDIRNELIRFQRNTIFTWKSNLNRLLCLSKLESNKINIETFKEIENKMSEFEKEIAHIDFNLLRIFACYKKARKKVVDVQSSIGFNDKINIINISKLKEISNYFEVFLIGQLDNNKLR